MASKAELPKLLLHPNTLVFFVDETGHESLADPAYPVFGYAGITMYAGLIDELVREPWRELKDNHFSGRDSALHASKLRSLTTEQMTALGDFFHTGRFGRFGVAITTKSKLPPDAEPLQIIPSLTRNRWQSLLDRVRPQPEHLAIIHESSERGDIFVNAFFGPTQATLEDRPIPVQHAFIPKSAGDEAMEVADFVAHALGREAFRVHFRSDLKRRRDFEAVFTNASDRSSVLIVDEAKAID